MAAGPAGQKLAQSVSVPSVHVDYVPHSCKGHMLEHCLCKSNNSEHKDKVLNAANELEFIGS